LVAVIWDVRNPLLALICQILFLAGWVIVFMSTALISHSDLFGLRQVYLQESYTQPDFRTPSIYKLVRHPIMLGFIIAFWATPKMTVGHLLFAGATTVYILIAIQLEERDLRNIYGQAYDDYRRRVSMLIPIRKRSLR
jgi:protein-S-isoprenylcysteine O-methyltransferase Ste14